MAKWILKVAYGSEDSGNVLPILLTDHEKYILDLMEEKMMLDCGKVYEFTVVEES